jgi:hypothetical protein
MMQKLLFISCIFILTVISFDTSAANLCSNLFAEISHSQSHIGTNSSSVDFDHLIKVSDAIGKQIKELYQFKQKSPQSEELIDSISKKLKDNYIPLLESILKKQKISYELIYINYGPEEYLKNLSYPTFVITSEGNSKLNRYAKGLRRRTGTRLIYSPVFNRASGFKSAFIPTENAIALHDQAILGTQFSDSKITPHELKHLLFHAERSGRYVPKFKSPVHGFVKNTKSFLESERKPYDSFFSFEELVTYAYSLTAAAKDILKNNSKQDLATYNKYIDILSDISTQSSDLLKTALLHLERLPWTVVDSEKALTVQITDDIKITLLVPNESLIEFQKDPFLYAKKEFYKMSQLSDFNLQYLQQMNQAGGLQKAVNFRSDQVQFLENLYK